MNKKGLIFISVVFVLSFIIKFVYILNIPLEPIQDFETLYNGFIGTSESSGTYFSQLQYKWLKEYIDAGLIEYFELMDYEELMDSIG